MQPKAPQRTAPSTAQPAAARAATTLAPLRVMRIVAVLASHADGLTLAELSARTGVPKSSLFSLLRTLESGGYVATADGVSTLGPESFVLGSVIARGRAFPENLRPLLSRLHRDGGETVLIAVPSDNWREIVYVDLLESVNSLRFRVSVGARDPLYGTALGLSMLAFAPDAVQARYVKEVQLKRLGGATIATKAELTRLLADARARGVLAIPSGINENVTAIAAPVFDAQGRVTAAVGLAGPSSHVAREEARLRALVARTGSQMSRALGWAAA